MHKNRETRGIGESNYYHYTPKDGYYHNRERPSLLTLRKRSRKLVFLNLTFIVVIGFGVHFYQKLLQPSSTLSEQLNPYNISTYFTGEIVNIDVKIYRQQDDMTRILPLVIEFFWEGADEYFARYQIEDAKLWSAEQEYLSLRHREPAIAGATLYVRIKSGVNQEITTLIQTI
ncbi:hypothetical protein [Entomospira culicis]|uniref:Uncharacterized protein n=1 Tax=Entomospira culicis TaxID=2719989 RepID=A0A968KUP3_9SPIO|nr:hypothetical protein [Entomospira culicis]NIZ19121.1 hypothetical protein [Entomospira culicis]NIZ69335.1 hypothetical protein [Entomospira culicis]WDI37921.1 hypothetical protein PVA46_03795 [Entomospira culicis]WDI39548.1 hypothetical protein PVA47_03795 [Entomospira culicis]